WESRGLDLLVPDLSPGPFESLTVTGQLEVLAQAMGGRSAVLIGSSMGGYLAALYAAAHPEVESLVLLAPAFRFAFGWAGRLGAEGMQQWEERGFLDVFHYAEGRPARVGYQLYTDALNYSPFPGVTQPCLIIHGREDQVVPVQYSEEFTRLHPGTRLLLMDDGHQLKGSFEDVARAIEAFLGLC
ncbi:MAG: alpha/beta fold hydrolase, partial [Acidobacteria bacterium]|nr:alpha/beta fold hydrolase [Acidobacteriota bacterium]